MFHYIPLFIMIVLAVTSAFADNSSNYEQYRSRSKVLLDAAQENTKTGGIVIGDVITLDNSNIKKNVDLAYEQHKSGLGVSDSDLDQAEVYMRDALGKVNHNHAVTTAAKQSFEIKNNGIDPAELASLYRKAEGARATSDQGPVLMIFASTSIPPHTLQVIGQQAKLVNAPIFLRGIAGGFSMEGIKKTLTAMRPATEQGAEVQIHPEMFKQYGVTQVPAIVLAEKLGGSCGQTTCGEHRMVVGDVTVEYALHQIARESGLLGQIARDKLELMNNWTGE